MIIKKRVLFVFVRNVHKTPAVNQAIAMASILASSIVKASMLPQGIVWEDRAWTCSLFNSKSLGRSTSLIFPKYLGF